jgi:tRNA nucleotidyltransferase (CCA-adding enzyme)
VAEIDPAAIPAAVRAVTESLASAGHDVHLVGGCVRDLLRGAPVADWDLATAARPEAVLALFPTAIPTGLRHGTVMVPTRAGPVDVTTYRAGARIEDDLGRRDFTLNAIALEPRSGRVLDPEGGRADLEARRLRAVRDAGARFAEDPLRAVRAARLVASLGLAPDAALLPAMRGARPGLAQVARERIRQELEQILLAPHAGRGLALLRQAGIEADWFPGAPADAATVVDALPVWLEVRLAGWLRGTRVAGPLARLRFPKRVVARVEHLLAFHPIEARVTSGAPPALRRLLRRVGRENLEPLLALREAELQAGDAAAADDAPARREQVKRLREALDAVERQGQVALKRSDLAIGGGEVMQILGCRPGPQVGRALEFLSQHVLDEPSENTPERLRELLARWRATPGGDAR